MVIKDPNNVTYDGRKKNSQIEIVQMEIIPVPASDQLLRGEIPTLNNLVIMQIKDTGVGYSYPSGKGILW